MDILAFCQKRAISTEGLRIRQTVKWNTKKTEQSKVLLSIELPSHFPEKYEKTVNKAVDRCLVAKLGKGLDPSSFEKAVTWSKDQ